jgi:hypothetical protein
MRIRLIAPAALLAAAGLVAAAATTASALVWTGPGEPPGSQPVAVEGYSVAYVGKCVDSGVAPADGEQLQIYDCNRTFAQAWVWSQGNLRLLGTNLCIEPAGGGTADGTTVQLAYCSGDPAQQWFLTGDNNLLNPQSNKCLDISDWQSDNGAPLQIWDCTGGDNQKWALPPYYPIF